MPDPSWSQQRLLEQYFAQSIRSFPDYPVVLSEGDSWFSFPGHANTLDHLDDLAKRRMSLLRLEQSGDTLLNMTAGSQRAQLRHLLTIYDIDALLFSGGGNDVVGPHLLELFDFVPPGERWDEFIIEEAMERQFRQIADAYHSLAHLRDVYRPECWIITHGYDYVKPSGKPTKFWLWPIPLSIIAGPWVRTNLEARGIVGRAQGEVVRYLIDRFNDTLSEVAAAHDRFVAIDNRGLLRANEWNDELHPTRAGFRKIAKSFLGALKASLPGEF